MNKKEELKRLSEIKNILLKNDIEHGITPEKLCNILEELGATFIKIGQILSTRLDILPKEYCDSLSKLRSNVKQMSKEELNDILINEYGDVSKVFKSIGKCIGAGSIAEVHLAVLLNDNNVVIKVLRKDVYEKMLMDVTLLKKVIKISHLDKIINVIDINSVLDEMLSVAKEECDLGIERSHLEKFKSLNKDVDYLYFPKVYGNISTNKVLVMEQISGFPINDKANIKKDNDLEDISYKLTDNYIKQALEDGFFHADPHPYNIFIKNNKIVFLDLGMMGILSEKNKKLLKKCINEIIEGDSFEVSNILVSMSTKRDEVDMIKLKNDVSEILNNFDSCNLDNIDTAKFISDMFNMLRSNNLILDKDVTMLIRGIAIIESTLENLNPNLSLMSVLINYSKKEDINLLDPDKIINDAKKVVKNTKSLINIPNEVLMFFKSLNNGDTKFKFVMSDSDKQIDKLEKLLHEFIIGILDASLILASSMVKDNNLKIIFIIFVVILSIWLIIKMIIDHIHHGY